MEVRHTRRFSPLIVAIAIAVSTFGPLATPLPVTAQETPNTPTPTVNAAQPSSPSDHQTDSTLQSGGAEIVSQSQADVQAETQSSAPFSLNQPSVQGVVTLDASAPNSVRAGELITYVFNYQNTGGSTATGIVVDVVWSDFSVITNGARQWCEPITCDPQNTTGPAVTLGNAPSGVSARYQVGDLGPSATGSFAVGLRSRSDIYPKTAQAIVRPAVSGKVYVSGNTNSIISDDTANTIVVGPVLTLTKSVTNMVDSAIYPLETAEFVIRVGNATSPGDVVGGQVRADARPANNVILRDTFPVGSDFVSATGSYVVDNSTRLITWTISTLDVGQYQDVHVVYRKQDVNQDCTKLNNKDYFVTSDEYPVNNGVSAAVTGFAVSVPVTTPILIKSITANPTNIAYGSEAAITITVQSYWTQVMSNVQLSYIVQQNAYFVAGSSSLVPTSQPVTQTAGGTVVWTFNMPAATKTNPTEVRITFRLRAAYGGSNGTGAGTASLTLPSEVPAACVANKGGRVTVSPRLSLKKSPGVTGGTQSQGDYIVTRNTEFEYLVEVTNNGTDTASGLTLIDHLPSELNANFSYVVGSATLNGSPYPPDAVQDGFSGSLTWNNLTVQAGETIKIRYRLLVDGTNFVRYCNLIEGVLGIETMRYIDRNVCVRVNPQIIVSKIANTNSTGKNSEVTFTLTLRNDEPTDSFEVGLQDVLGSFTYVRQVSGYSQPTLGGGIINWDVVTVNPGEEIQVVIVARTPDVCQTKDYYNEARFQTRDVIDGQIYTVQPLPSVKAKIKVVCGTNILEYTKTANRSPISLGDLVAFTLYVTNTNTTQAVTDVSITDIMPEAFTYVGLDTTSMVKTEPTITTNPDGRTRLAWNVASINKSAKVTVKFWARSGNLVAQAKNYMTVDAPNLLSANCKGACESVDDNGELKVFAVGAVAVQPLITMEPYITDSTCAQPHDTRIYRLTILNTNVHTYTQTGITVTLPPGLYFSRALDGTPNPSTLQDNEGLTHVRWSDLEINEKPDNAFGSQLVYTIELRVGQVLGNLATVVQTTSPDGLIPRKDGVDDPTVVVCAGPDPAIAKDVNKHQISSGEEVVYIISLANPLNIPITTTVVDTLPMSVTFISADARYTPTVVGSQITWNNIVIPAGSSNKPGTIVLRFRAQAVGDTGDVVTNSAQTQNSSTPVVDVRYNTITMLIRALYYTFLALSKR